MREIKFRAWDGEKMISNFAHIGENGRMYTSHTPEPEPNYQVMQFTGLKDKNGVEIYEGDIVQDHRKATFEIKFGLHGRGDTVVGFYGEPNNGMGLDIENPELEVIGNIYENPELMNSSNGKVKK